MPPPTCPQCHGPLPHGGTTCPQCGAYVPAWLARGGQAHGPYDWETLELLYFQGRLRPEDRVTWDPQGNWLTPGEVFATPAPLAPPPPAPPAGGAHLAPPTAPPQPLGPPTAPPGRRSPVAHPASRGRASRWLWLGPLLAVVIFLAGGLVGGLFANQGLGLVRQTAERERCAGQLKVIALGMRMYVMDYGAPPPGGAWQTTLEARGIPRATWVCPARHDGIPYPTAREMNPQRLESGDRGLATVADAPLPNGHGPHGGKCNAAYADGHVEEADKSPLVGGKGAVVTWRRSLTPAN